VVRTANDVLKPYLQRQLQTLALVEYAHGLQAAVVDQVAVRVEVHLDFVDDVQVDHVQGFGDHVTPRIQNVDGRRSHHEEEGLFIWDV